MIEVTEVDVAFEKFAFAGPLSFIETLRELVPLDGFSDPPDIAVTSEGITAGFSMGLPNIAFGVFSLENLSLAAGFSIPFVGPPMSTWFRFCERENPSRLTVMMFGGGFYFGVIVNADGLQVAEGAIEFGAAISVDFGVASGSVSAMAGLYFKFESGATPATPAVPSTEAKTPPRRYDWGSPEDFQLQQALNHLKGKTVHVAKPKEAVANVAPSR